MNLNRRIEEFLLRKYLEKKGWKRQASGDWVLSICEEQYHLIGLDADEAACYDSMLSEIAAIEGRSTEEVDNEILTV